MHGTQQYSHTYENISHQKNILDYKIKLIVEIFFSIILNGKA